MSSQEPAPTPAEVQFNTSSLYARPSDWPADKPLFQIYNEYPNPVGAAGVPTLPLPDIAVEAPWLHVRFDTEPENYARTVKEYCWDGNRPVDFVVQENKVSLTYVGPSDSLNQVRCSNGHGTMLLGCICQITDGSSSRV